MSRQSDGVIEIVAQMAPILSGHPPEIQGAALADLLAIWLAAHPEELRAAVLRVHLEYVHQLVPLNATLIKLQS